MPAIALPASMALPPPIAITASHRLARKAAAPSRTSATVGSSRTGKRAEAMPALFRSAITFRNRLPVLPVTSRTRLPVWRGDGWQFGDYARAEHDAAGGREFEAGYHAPSSG